MKVLKFNYKFIFIAFALLFSLFLFSNNSYATIDVLYEGEHHLLPDFPTDTDKMHDYNHCAHFFIVYDENNNTYHSFFYSNRFRAFDSENFYQFTGSGTSGVSWFTYVVGTDTDWTYRTQNTTMTVNNTGDWICIYSDIDLHYWYYGAYNAETERDTYFFHLAPHGGIQQVQVQQTILQVEELEKIPQGITQTLMTIIPVGLLGLLIFLVIFLIRLVILRVT